MKKEEIESILIVIAVLTFNVFIGLLYPEYWRLFFVLSGVVVVLALMMLIIHLYKKKRFFLGHYK